MKQNLRKMKAFVACAAVGLAVVGAKPVQADILLYDDSSPLGESRWSDALTGLGETFTFTRDETQFQDELASGTWDFVVAQIDGNYRLDATAALSDYATSGGKVIFSHWQSFGDAAFDVTRVNENLNTLTVGPLFSSGLSSPTLTVDTSLWGIGSQSFVPTLGEGVAAATYEDGNAGIVIGNAGRTIINGFQGDTLASADEVQLYQNQANYMLAATPTPEPGTWAMMGIGLCGVVLMGRKKKLSASKSLA